MCLLKNHNYVIMYEEMPNTHTQGTTGDSGQSQQTPQWLYDEIMLQIEPDLVTDQIPLLEERYKDEPENERQARMERYDRAFDAFDTELQNFSDELYARMEEDKAAIQSTRDMAEQDEKKSAVARLESALDFPQQA